MLLAWPPEGEKEHDIASNWLVPSREGVQEASVAAGNVAAANMKNGEAVKSGMLSV